MSKDSNLNVIDFGRKLIETSDLDPIYIMLHQAELPIPTLKRWLLAYWCFYHSGTASWITSCLYEKQYWERFMTAAKSSDYPRCHERRHFRAANAIKSVEWLSQHSVDSLFQPLINASCESHEIMNYVQTWVGFGPWIAFKVADMIERLGLSEVRFKFDDLKLYESPEKAAQVMWSQFIANSDLPNQKPPLNKSLWAVRRIIDELRYDAPPRYERKVGIQEAETVLCKWGSYLKGKYHLGEDVIGLRKSLEQFSTCSIAKKLLQYNPTPIT